MLYMLWMIKDMNEPLPDNVLKALEYGRKKYGIPPQPIVECSNQLKPLPNIENISLHPVQIPSNILLIGVDEPDETKTS